ncbi:MAG: transcriptional repressor NrdR [Ruminococcaceae bacterium]|jgi:transcriptional repressor NrdR|nr:transcriptional repressor NrdR [Oscillospiraceae bacterium]MBR5553052.1 transcriptional repressor NrdR [Clostridia bacterium]
MKCPSCGNFESKVLDSRPSADNTSIRRRRECLACQKRFTTFETIENVAFVVVKKNGNREMFDRTKLVNGMIRACEKRPVSVKQIENAVNEIEANLQSSMRSEVPSTEIGELVMEKLKALDEVAYVRFASVYRQFKDINTFMEELKKLLGEGNVPNVK